MQSPESYDPTPDLEAQRPHGGARFGLFLMLAVAIVDFGAFLQTKMITVFAETYVNAWIWAKLGVALLALHTTVRTTRLRDGTSTWYPGVAAFTFLEAASWLVFALVHGSFSCFAIIAVLPSALALLASFPVREAAKAAASARERLEASGIDDTF